MLSLTEFTLWGRNGSLRRNDFKIDYGGMRMKIKDIIAVIYYAITTVYNVIKLIIDFIDRRKNNRLS